VAVKKYISSIAPLIPMCILANNGKDEADFTLIFANNCLTFISCSDLQAPSEFQLSPPELYLELVFPIQV